MDDHDDHDDDMNIRICVHMYIYIYLIYMQVGYPGLVGGVFKGENLENVMKILITS